MKRPTRRDFLLIVGELQNLLGKAINQAHDDRNPNRVVDITNTLKKGFKLAFDSLQFDDSMDGKKSRNGWCIEQQKGGAE